MNTLANWIFGATGLAFVIYLVVMAIRYRGSGDWPTTAGTVEITEIRYWGPPGSSDASSGYCGVVRYSYVANGERYSGEYKTTRRFFKKQEAVDFVATHFPAGQELVVRYHPKKPDRSAIDVDVDIYKRDDMIRLKI